MQRARQRKGMGEVLREAEGLVEVRASLRGIPTHPQRPGINAKARDARVYTAIAIGQPVVLRRIIEGNRVLQVGAGQGGVAQHKPTDPERIMRLQEQRRILDALRELEALLAELHAPSDVRRGPYKRTTGSTGPGNVLGSHRSVGTTHGRACRPGRLLGPRILWSPSMPVPGWLRSRARAGCAAGCLGAW